MKLRPCEGSRHKTRRKRMRCKFENHLVCVTRSTCYVPKTGLCNRCIRKIKGNASFLKAQLDKEIDRKKKEAEETARKEAEETAKSNSVTMLPQ